MHSRSVFGSHFENVFFISYENTLGIFLEGHGVKLGTLGTVLTISRNTADKCFLKQWSALDCVYKNGGE